MEIGSISLETVTFLGVAAIFARLALNEVIARIKNQ